MTWFRSDPITKKNKWAAQGDRLILLLDANEYMNNGNLARDIISEPKLKMKNIVKEKEC